MNACTAVVFSISTMLRNQYDFSMDIDFPIQSKSFQRMWLDGVFAGSELCSYDCKKAVSLI